MDWVGFFNFLLDLMSVLIDSGVVSSWNPIQMPVRAACLRSPQGEVTRLPARLQHEFFIIAHLQRMLSQPYGGRIGPHGHRIWQGLSPPLQDLGNQSMPLTPYRPTVRGLATVCAAALASVPSWARRWPCRPAHHRGELGYLS